MKKDLKAFTYGELKKEAEKLGLPPFRAEQIFIWLHRYGVTSFDEMTNISKDLRSVLSARYYISSCVTEQKFVSKKDETVKFLFKLQDEEYVETVVMKYRYGYSVCVSSQVGCKMGYTFCASTLAGFKRNLTAGEIESQIHTAQSDLGIRISNIVLMGIGEPLDNFNSVVDFIYNVNSENGLNISMRNISLSTCGIVPKIKELMKLSLPITLSVSLHAPNDGVRGKIMPVNGKWGVDEILSVCREYSEKTGRRISFEYTLIKGVNDGEAHAEELSEKLKNMLCHVNLIPVNDVRERKNVKTDKENIYKFSEILKSHGINATIRRTLGSDIDASCGQLRRKRNEVGQ